MLPPIECDVGSMTMPILQCTRADDIVWPECRIMTMQAKLR